MGQSGPGLFSIMVSRLNGNTGKKPNYSPTSTAVLKMMQILFSFLRNVDQE